MTERTEDAATFLVPSWRNDIASGQVLAQAPTLDEDVASRAASHVQAMEAECDLLEEVLRLYGLDNVPAVALPQTTVVPAPAVTPLQARAALLRRVCAARGLTETVGFSFVAQDDAALFGDVPETQHLLNPIATDLDQLRPTPLINLARACHAIWRVVWVCRVRALCSRLGRASMRPGSICVWRVCGPV